MKKIVLIVTAASLFGTPADAVSICQDQKGSHTFNCDRAEWVIAGLPCGETKNDNGDCFRFHTTEKGCFFALGNQGTPDYDLVWWPLKDVPTHNKPQPSPAECTQVEQAIQRCAVQESWEPGCPDPIVSDPCELGCEALTVESSKRFARPSPNGWDEKCHAYALMPRGWRLDPWLPAEMFLTVGKAFPLEGRSWRVEKTPENEGGLYRAEHALAEGRLGPTILGVVGSTALWGGEEGKISQAWRSEAKTFGVCVHQNGGAFLASPHWPGYGKGWFPAVMRCDGSLKGPEARSRMMQASSWDEAAWADSGLMASEVLPRLRKLTKGGRELVCVTPELAQARRLQRSKLVQSPDAPIEALEALELGEDAGTPPDGR